MSWSLFPDDPSRQDVMCSLHSTEPCSEPTIHSSSQYRDNIDETLAEKDLWKRGANTEGRKSLSVDCVPHNMDDTVRSESCCNFDHSVSIQREGWLSANANPTPPGRHAQQSLG